jgi:soluble lytic murein transglycosylase-like protein
MPKRRRNPMHANTLPAAGRRILRGIRLGLGAAQTLSISQMVVAAANGYGVDPSLALAVAQRESGINPNLVNATSGAAGVMQLMPATARDLGVTNIMDPGQNINAGIKYLAQLLSRYGGDTAKALAAYDWGPTKVDSAIAQYGDNWLSAAPSETQNYVAALTGETPQQTVTIDASTGEPVTDTVNVTPVQAGLGPIDLTDPTTLMWIVGAGLAVWLLGDFLAG